MACGILISDGIPEDACDLSGIPTTSGPDVQRGRWKKVYTVVIVLVLAAGIVGYGIAYGLSYQSARGLTVEIAQVSRTYNPGPYLASIEFDIEAHVWSTNSLDTTVDKVQFFLSVDTIGFPTISAIGSTFSLNHYLRYDLRFVDDNSQDATLLGGRTTHRVTLSAATVVSAGFYSGSDSPGASRMVTISRVTDATVNPTVVNECQIISRDVLLGQPGGVTINLSSSPDTLLVTIKNSGGTYVFNQEAASFDSTLRLPIDTYNVHVENPGFFCTGANDQVSGSIDFWHEQTNLVA